MKHIDSDGKPACGSTLTGDWSRGDEHGNVTTGKIPELTATALASSCDACRATAGVARVEDIPTGSKKILGVQPVPSWEPEPYANADEILEYVARRRSD